MEFGFTRVRYAKTSPPPPAPPLLFLPHPLSETSPDMTAQLNYARVGDLPIEAVTDELTAHYLSTPIFAQLHRESGDFLTDREFTAAARDAVDLIRHGSLVLPAPIVEDFPPTPDLFAGLIAIIEEVEAEEEVSVWDRIEAIWQAVQVYVCILGAGAMLGLIGWLWLVSA